MPERDEILSGLPNGRDDEPRTLRADIVDELTDHLESAFQRELHRADNADDARQNVLARFGNPAAIARRLWYDAMKDRIMSQRLTMAAAIIMAVACVGMFVVVLQMRSDSDAAALERAELQALLTESQELNRELSAKSAQAVAAEENLHELVNTLTARLDEVEETAAGEVSDWNPVEFRLVQGDEDGPPAEGFKVYMSIDSPDSGIPPLFNEADEQGVARFERVRYGRYDVRILAPWRETANRQVMLRPGESYSATIVCPAAAPDPLEAELAVDWPDDLDDKPLFVSVEPWSARRRFGEDDWSRGRYYSEYGPVFVASTGDIHYGQRFRSRRGRGGSLGIPDRFFVGSAEPESPVSILRWPGRDYRVPEVSFHVSLSSEDSVGRSRRSEDGAVHADGAVHEVKVATIESDELQWRVEGGTPERIVIVPPSEVVAAVREFLTVLAEQGSSQLLRRPSVPALPLPPVLMGKDLVVPEP